MNQRNEISAFFAVSRQNGFSSTLHWRATLPSLCISYLYAHPVFSVLHAFFWVLQGWVARGSDVRL